MRGAGYEETQSLKHSKYFILGLTVALFFAACGTRESSSIPTGTPIAAATPEPTLSPQPSPTPALTETYTFDFSQTSYLLAHNCSYEIDEDGAITLQYDAQYGQVMLALPEAVDMLNCSKVTVRAKSEYGMIVLVTGWWSIRCIRN